MAAVLHVTYARTLSPDLTDTAGAVDAAIALFILQTTWLENGHATLARPSRGMLEVHLQLPLKMTHAVVCSH